jgi:hypothetical protein
MAPFGLTLAAPQLGPAVADLGVREPAEGPLRRHVAEIEMERLAVLRAGLLLAWDYGPVRCSSAYVFHDHANR